MLEPWPSSRLPSKDRIRYNISLFFFPNCSYYHVASLSTQDVYEKSLKKQWLSDPATYPLMVVFAGAAVVTVVMAANGLRQRGVKISPERKNAVINEWDSPTERQAKVADKVGWKPPMYSDKFDSLKHGGLGVGEDTEKHSDTKN